MYFTIFNDIYQACPLASSDDSNKNTRLAFYILGWKNKGKYSPRKYTFAWVWSNSRNILPLWLWYFENMQSECSKSFSCCRKTLTSQFFYVREWKKSFDAQSGLYGGWPTSFGCSKMQLFESMCENSWWEMFILRWLDFLISWKTTVKK